MTFFSLPFSADAACRGVDPSVFFPERGQDAEPAKAICATCRVCDECRAWALDGKERLGVWGGLSERQRRRIRSKRRREAMAS